jgi:hypothetical protein
MSYKRVGQRLVTDKGVTHRMIEALRSILKAILLVFGRDKRMLLAGSEQGPGRSERTYVNAPGVDPKKGPGGRQRERLDQTAARASGKHSFWGIPTPPGARGAAAIDGATPAYKPFLK